jgi:hypothetical protein
MATIQQKIALVGADDVKKAIADIVNTGQTGFDALQKAINAVEAKQFDAQISSAKSSIGDLVKSIGGMRAAIAGSAVAAAVLGFVKLVQSANEAALSIDRSARAAAISRQNYQALATAVKDAGGSQEQLDAAARKFAQQVESQGQEQYKALIGGVKLFIQATGGASSVVLRTAEDFDKAKAAATQLAPAFKAVLQQLGDRRALDTVESLAFQLTNLLQGASTGVDDASAQLRKFFASMGAPVPGENVFERLDQLLEKSKNTLASLNISLIDTTTGGLKKPEQALLEFVDAISKIKDPAEQAQRILKVFGRSAGPELVEAIRGGLANIERIKAELRKRGVLLSDDDIAQARAQAAVFNELSDSWSAFVTTIGQVFGPLLSGVLKGVTFLLDGFLQVVQAWRTSLFGALKLAWNDIAATAQAAWDKIGSGFSALIDKIKALIASVAGLFNLGVPFASPLGVEGHATGGLIRGRPGIDTNLAWLTDGEYVIPRHVVGKFGVSFFDALRTGNLLLDNLRGFSLGGLVENLSAPFAIPTFAGGGLNSAKPARSGLRPLTLVINGKKFGGLAVTDDRIAQGMIRYARKSSTRSAGRSPSRVR